MSAAASQSSSNTRAFWGNAAILAGETIHYGRSRRPGMARSLYFAQLGRETRREADALCARLRKAGDDCMVLRN